MRVFFATAALVVCALMGYASSGTSSAQGQMTQAGIAIDETLMFYFDRDKPGLSCTVADVRGDFVRCKGALSPTSPQHWYNLQLVAQIDRPKTQ